MKKYTTTAIAALMVIIFSTVAYSQSRSSGARGGSGPPSGAAGGDLGGTYPNPTVVSISNVTTGVLPLVNGGPGAAAASANAAFNALSPMTTGGDIIYGGASGAGTRLANGSSGQFLKSNGTTTAPSWATPSTVATAVPLSGITAATGTNTIANGLQAQVWNWDTLTTETAMKIASTSMTSGSLLNLTDTFNDSTSTGNLLTVVSTGVNNASVGISISSAATNSTARGMTINMSGGSGGATALAITTASQPGISAALSGTGSSTAANFTTASNSGGTALNGYATGSTGANFGLTARVDSTDPGAIAALITQGSGSATGTAIKTVNNGGALGVQVTASGTGIVNQVRIDNTVTAANNSGSALIFAANRTGTTNTIVAGVAGIITDITAGAYKGALIFQTSSNGAPAERMRIDDLGDLILTSAVVAGTGTTAGVSVTENSLTTGNGVDVSTSSLTTGNLMKLTSTSTAAASNTQTILNIATSGTNGTSAQTTYGMKISNTHAGTTSTNVGLYSTASGGTTANYAAIFDAGNVGIGTTAPGAKLTVTGGAVAIDSGQQIYTNGNGDTSWQIGRNVGSITTSMISSHYQALTAPSDGSQGVVIGVPSGNSIAEFSATDSGTLYVRGRFGLGVSATSAQLHTSSTVRFANFGVGTCTFDANGNITSVSDERLKNISGDFSDGLAQIKLIQPIIYKWKKATGLDPVNDYVGFSAQNVREAIPSAVYAKKSFVDQDGEKVNIDLTQDKMKSISKDDDGKVLSITDDKGNVISLPSGSEEKETLSLSDRPIIAALVNAVKELSAQNAVLEQRINALEKPE